MQGSIRADTAHGLLDSRDPLVKAASNVAITKAQLSEAHALNGVQISPQPWGHTRPLTSGTKAQSAIFRVAVRAPILCTNISS